MIDIFFREVRRSENEFLRVVVTTAQDAERAHALVAVLCAGDAPWEAPSAGGRPSRRRGTIAQLIKRRDQVLDRELRGAMKSTPSAAARGNILPYKKAIL